MQGQMMSLVMFAAVALDPFSQATSGVLRDIGLTGLFLAAGTAMFVTAFVALLSRTATMPHKFQLKGLGLPANARGAPLRQV
ncbi:MAG: hypothetical protein HC919_08505 [Oscillatoriales cyanobacterium SM2_2_1]|nr:hypothetical protein [Oscillatoriales cyanobacterium SM2_2_1]